MWRCVLPAGKRVVYITMAGTATLGLSGKKGISVVIEKTQRDAVTAAMAAVNPAEDTADLREQILLELVRQARESQDDETILLTWVPLTDEMRRLVGKFFWDNASKPKPLKPPMQADIIDLYRSGCPVQEALLHPCLVSTGWDVSKWKDQEASVL